MSDIVKIDFLGHQGDGIAHENGNAIYVPYSLEGEEIEVEGDSAQREFVSVKSASKDRIDPFCRHFGSCGSCQLQHFDHDAYLDWKVDVLKTTLKLSGIEHPIEPIKSYPRASRRRVVLTGMRTQAGIVFGFSERNSNKIVGIKGCPVLLSELEAALPFARDISRLFAPRHGSIRANILVCENGIDLSIEVNKEKEQKSDANLVREAITHPSMAHFIRLSVDGETVLEKERPVLKAGDTLVCPPPSAFVQANEAAEQDMADLVTKHLKSCKKVIDLFCGFGPFALRLAKKSEVIASEFNQPALDMLDRAWRETGGKLKKISVEKRDLSRRPFAFLELKYIDGVVFDPPRAGAEFQCTHLAKSNVKKIAAISCDPKTLARDLKILIEGGFSIKSITPIDQFAFSHHLETVVLLERKKK
ncbi:MAG: class I SAM-dependent RNA methyltransferase [Nitratireductor sp.]